MFKIKRTNRLVEMKGVRVGMIVQIYNNIYEITTIRTESWGKDSTFIACGTAVNTPDNKTEYNLFQIDNFYDCVLNGTVKVLDDGIQSEQIPEERKPDSSEGTE